MDIEGILVKVWDMALASYGEDSVRLNTTKWAKEEICQLFESKPDKPNPINFPGLIPSCKPSKKSKSDKSKELELSKGAWKMFLSLHASDCDTNAFVDKVVSDIASIKDAECQARVKVLIKEIEDTWSNEFCGVRRENSWWQALKKREGYE